MDDLMALREKAKMYSQSSTVCHFLYRNKSPQYFSDMFSNDGGIMKGYVKDNSGDQASPINGQIDGLSCSAVQTLATVSIRLIYQLQ